MIVCNLAVGGPIYVAILTIAEREAVELPNEQSTVVRRKLKQPRSHTFLSSQCLTEESKPEMDALRTLR
jgi:hypothetical protein